jgi:hypothetical protein
MLNFRPPNAPAYGFQIGPDGLPTVGAPSNDIPEAWKSIIDFAYGAARPGLPSQPPQALALFGQRGAAPDSQPAPNGPNDGEIHQVKDPLRCSGPNSSCELPLKKRAPGVFLDPQNPPLRLCQDCFRRSQGRPPTGDDT